MSGITRRRVLYLGAVVAMIGLSAGFVLAATLNSTNVTQSAALYTVTSSASASFPTAPTATVAVMPGAVSACSSSAVTLGSGASVDLYLPASSSITCTASDFAEEFTLSSSGTAAAGSYAFTIYTSYGAGPTTGAAVGTVTIASALSSAGTVNVYVDYGSVTPPTSITSLSLVVA